MATPRNPPYGTPQAPLLTVHGQAELEVDPEIARLAVTLTARGRDRRTTLDDLTHRNTTTLTLIKSYGEAVADLSTGALSLTPELGQHGRGERVRTYHGTVHLTADLTDFTALGELATRLADLDLTTVDGPWWTLRPHSPAHRRARQQAVHDALRRAREYAEALDTTLAALIELADTGSAVTGLHPQTRRTARMTRSAATAKDESTPEPLDLEPQRQQVRAEVSAHFTMNPPQL
ncbi:SIMPL domain-containing protein [Streptomyces rishiriensis]|uniref:SIMPL domain-containing protein n=1 Tax=Streptomyces rishiriensis TaxID=68264 RepID=UPI0037AF1F6B